METTIILGVVLAASFIVECVLFKGNIPNKWTLLVLVGAISWDIYSDAPIRLLSGVLFFVVMYLAWRNGAVGGGLVKLSLGIGALLSLTAASFGLIAFVIALVVTDRFKRFGEVTIPGSVVLALTAALGLAGEVALRGVSALP